MTAPRLTELGFSTLAGAPKSPRDLIDEVRTGEELGLGTVFISERWNVKEAATLAGAVGAVSSEIGIATAATHYSTRHPLITASHATTMHTLTGGRYTLGLGRGVRALFDAFRLSPITTAQLEDFATLLPAEWLAPAATGTPEQCATAVGGQLDLGAAGVILHGATPGEIAPIVTAYRTSR